MSGDQVRLPNHYTYTNSTYNTLIRAKKELPIVPSTLSVTYSKVEDDNSDCFSFAFSDNDTPPLQRSSRIRYEPTRYGLVTQHIAFSPIAQSEIREPLSYQTRRFDFWNLIYRNRL